MEAQVINNIKHIDPSIIAELELTNEDFYESWMLTNIQQLPRMDGIWIDVGAHVGNHTVFFSNHCDCDEVWSYEPSKVAFSVLKENVNNNPGRTVRLFNCAVGSKKGFAHFKEEHNEPGKSAVVVKRGRGTTTVEILGDISAKVALIKIDVEGFEFEVLKGAMAVIERDLPELFVETFESWNKVFKMLPNGYKLISEYNNAPTFHFSAKEEWSHNFEIKI